jgi:hypothetical protein
LLENVIEEVQGQLDCCIDLLSTMRKVLACLLSTTCDVDVSTHVIKNSLLCDNKGNLRKKAGRMLGLATYTRLKVDWRARIKSSSLHGSGNEG